MIAGRSYVATFEIKAKSVKDKFLRPCGVVQFLLLKGQVYIGRTGTDHKCADDRTLRSLECHAA